MIYALISVEDLLNLIDLGTIVPGNRGLRGLILIFVLASVLFYILFIFQNIRIYMLHAINVPSISR